MPFGLREEVIVSEAEKLGLRAFSLSCGHSPRFEDSATGKARTIHLGIRLPAREKPIPAITHVIGL